jgi:hypothetical protein
LLTCVATENSYALTFASQTASLPVTLSVAKNGYVGTLSTTLV